MFYLWVNAYMISIFVKSITEQTAPDDGFRVFVDTNMPKGLNEASAKVDLWLGGIAPSPRLHKWYRNDSAKWDDFLERYFVELDENNFAVTELFQKMAGERMTLLYATKDAEFNTAVALKQYLEGLN